MVIKLKNEVESEVNRINYLMEGMKGEEAATSSDIGMVENLVPLSPQTILFLFLSFFKRIIISLINKKILINLSFYFISLFPFLFYGVLSNY